MAAKFSTGTKVNHPADPNGTFPAGTGVVTTVTPGKSGANATYAVKCDATGKVLSPEFKETDLSAV